MGSGEDRRRLALGALAVAAVAVLIALLVSGGGSPRPTTSAHTTSPTTTTAPATTTTAPAPAPGPPAQPPPSAELLGASVNRLFNDRAYTPRVIDDQLRALRATGAGVARSDALWEAIEPAPPTGGVHRYDWSFDDAVAGALAAHRLQWLPIIDYSAPWAKVDPAKLHSPPRSPSDYAAYAGAFAARYGQRGSFWRAHPNLPAMPVDTFEIWNEPDGGTFWAPAPDPVRYADLYLGARDAITAVDPSARVIVGGLTHATAFLPAMLAARPELRGHVDGVAIHPYSLTPLGILASVVRARGVLRTLGMATVPLYVTEFGWTISPAGADHYVSERLRPAYIAGTIAGLSRAGCGVAAIVLYTWVTPERNRRDSEDWFGIHPPGGASSADTNAFVSALRQAATASPGIGACAG